jgi:hypothetical protein
MSGSQLVPPAMTKLPAAIRKFWGPPPILPSESAESYWTFAAAIARSIGPLDAILWSLVKDVVDYSWEIRGRGSYLERQRLAVDNRAGCVA